MFSYLGQTGQTLDFLPALIKITQVGQYLRLGDLEQPPDRGDSFWHKFLRENPHVAEVDGVILPSDKTSLALEKELLKVG